MEATRPGWTVKAIVVIIFTSILFRCVSARNHTVGGLSGWDFNSHLQLWSDSITFHEGDNLVFKYGPVHDVLEVNREDYRMCRTINPIITHTDGSSVVPLTEAGTRYFICGRRGHCSMGLRLRVRVLALESSASAPANNDTSSSNGSSSSSPQPGGGSHSEARRGRGRRRPRPIPRFDDSHSPPSASDDHTVPPPPPPVEGPPPQLPRSASSSAAGDGGFMIMMLMITGGLVYCFLTFRPQVVFA